MQVRKPLVVAMLAAGLIGSEAIPQAQSTVFVPELAMLDGMVCAARAARSMRPVLVAQAKTEVSPAGQAAASAAPAQPPADPPLILGLGKHSFKISTASKAAQQYFDQGLRLAWGFNHAEAQRAFQKAQRLDPACAMCYWGEAYVLGPNINVPMDPQANGPALAALGKARALAAKASPREQALIAALGARYSDDPKLERPMLDEAYAAAMAGAARRFAQDNDILALYAEALMDRSPWNYWEPNGARSSRRSRRSSRRSRRCSSATRRTSARSTSTSTPWRRRATRCAPSATPTGWRSSRPARGTSYTCRATSTWCWAATRIRSPRT